LEPEPEPLEKKQEPELETEPLGKKIRSRSRLKKKSGVRAGAGKKFAGSPALVFTVRCGALVVQEKKYFLGIHGVYLSLCFPILCMCVPFIPSVMEYSCLGLYMQQWVLFLYLLLLQYRDFYMRPYLGPELQCTRSSLLDCYLDGYGRIVGY